MQASIALLLGLVTCHLNQSNMGARKLWLKDLDHKGCIFAKKSISQRLKKSKKFSFRNSLVAMQHNISLNGTKSKIFDRVSPKYFVNNPTCKACQCDANIACNSVSATYTVGKRPFPKEMAF